LKVVSHMETLANLESFVRAAEGGSFLRRRHASWD
jgi:hypothetical protein